MFRRREDGTEELITGTESSGAAPTAAATPVMAPVSAAAAMPSAPSIATTSAPAMPTSAPQAQAFRPAPPQAAMAASRPAPMTPATPAPMPVSAATPVSHETPRTAATPVHRPNAKRILTVGPDIQMKGEITSCDRVVIEGAVDATMRDVHTVELAETGALKGTAEVEDAEISGAFEGDLVVRGKLTIHASGRVRGNITYGEIEIQRGGQISGNIRNVADAKMPAMASNQPKAKAA